MENYKNCIIIPNFVKQTFIRKFCFQKFNSISKRREYHLDINGILALSFEQCDDQIGNRTDTACLLQFSRQNHSFTKITFDTPYGPLAHELFYQMVIRLNISVLEYSWLKNSCEDWGTIEYEYQPTHTNNPFNHFNVYKNVMDQCKSQFSYVVELFYGQSKHGLDLIATHIGSILDDGYDYNEVA